jgi:autotransporter-associated beta strand protein
LRATDPDFGLDFGSNVGIIVADSSGSGYLRIESGTYPISAGIRIGENATYHGEITVTGGAVLKAKDGNMDIQNGKVVLDNGTIEISKTGKYVSLGNQADGCELHIENGGLLTTSLIWDGNKGKTSTVLFNGGTLKANGVFSTSWPAIIADKENITVNVGANGGTIDASGFNIQVARPIAAADGANDGGMTFKGGGSVSLKYANTYTGGTTIEADTTLKLNTTAKTSLVANSIVVTIPAGGVADGSTVLEITDGGTFSQAECDAISFSDSRYILRLADNGAKVVIEDTQAGEYVWNDGASGASWKTAGKWSKNGVPGNWYDSTVSVFATDGDAVQVDSAVTAASIEFRGNATVNGSATLTVPTVTVAEGKVASIAGPTAGVLEKTGAGALTLGSSRTDTTTLSEGTLIANAPVGTLVFGTANPVTFDYVGQTLSPIPASVTGGDVTLKNGKFGAISSNFTMNSGKLFVEGDDAAMNMSQGSFGQANGTAATYIQVGGTLKANSHFRLYRGEINLTNVTFTAGANIEVGNTSAAAHGAMTMSGCEASVSGNLNVFNGELVITNGATTVGNSKLVYMSSDGNSALLALKAGGCLTAPLIQQYGTTGTGTIRFDGGTLKANAANSNGLVQNHTGLAVEVTANGGTIDAGKYNVTMHRPISGEGGMTFKGGGSVTLSAAPTYDGVTTVEVGTTLVLPEAIAGEKLAFTIPAAGLEKGIYEVMRISGGGEFALGAIDVATKPADASAQFCLNADNTSIVCAYGYEQGENAYIGGSGGSLSNPDNWTTGFVPTSGEVTFDFTAPTTLTVGDTFKADTIIIPTSSAVVTIGAGDLRIAGSLTNACKLAIAQGASLNVAGDLVTTGVNGGNPIFLYSNEGLVTVGRVVCSSVGGAATPTQYQVVSENTKPIRTCGFVSDKQGGNRVFFKLNAANSGTGAWVVGADGFTFNNAEARWNSCFYAQSANVTLYSSADWTLANSGRHSTDRGDLCVYDDTASITIDTSDYDEPENTEKKHTVTLKGRLDAQGNVTIAGCGTLVVDTTNSNSGLSEIDQNTNIASGKTIAVTDTATLQVNAGKKILGAGTISLSSGTTLAFESTGREFATPDIVPVMLPDEGAATIRIDGKRLVSGKHVLCTLASVPENLSSHVIVTGTALDGRKYKVETEEVTENEKTVINLVINIYPDGFRVIVR